MQCRYCLLQEFSYNKCARLFYLGQYRVELSGYSWVTSFYFLSGIHSGVETRKYQIKYFFLSLKIVNCLCRIFFSLYTAYRVGIGIWKAEISSKIYARDVEFLNAIFGIFKTNFCKKNPSRDCPHMRGCREGVLKGARWLRLFYEARLNGLCANPQALYRAVFGADAHSLDIGFEGALVLLDELQADAAAFLALAFVDNLTTFNRAFPGYCAYSWHGAFSLCDELLFLNLSRRGADFYAVRFPRRRPES